MTEQSVIRRLAAILSADVKDYSRLMSDDEVRTIRLLKDSQELISRHILQHHGRVVDSPGDNLLAEFASVVDAVQAATAIQKELKARNAGISKNRRMEFRIGINLGDIIVDGERIYGDGVNIAARLEGLAHPGGICISRTAYEQIDDKLPLAYEYLGEMTVKNIQKPICAFRVHLEPAWFPGRKGRKKFPQESDTGMDFNQSYTAKPGSPRSETRRTMSAGSRKVRSIALVLCVCFGIFGVHRFYVGKTRTAKIQLFSLGGLGIWFLLDLILLLVGEFKDAEGRKMRDWI